MSIRILTLGLLCITSCNAQTAKLAYAWTSATDSVIVQKAVLYIEIGKAGEALAELTKLSDATAKLPSTYFLTGVAHVHLKNYDLAIAPLQHVIDVVPDNIEPYYFRGLALFEQKRYAQAADDLILCARVWPYEVTLYEPLKQSLLKDHARQSTVINLTESAGTDTTAAIFVAEYYMFTSSPKRAIDLLQPLLAHYPQFLRGWETISFAYAQKKKFTKAIWSINKVLDAKPDYGRAHYLKGWYIHNSGKHGQDKTSFDLAKQYGYHW